jgi:hypothetical protein
MARRAVATMMMSLLVGLAGAGAAAQTASPDPNRGAPGRGPARRAPGEMPRPLSPLGNEEVYRLLDAFVMTRAQAVLQLSDEQYSAFFQRMTRLQTLQRQHRRQRMRILNELRQMVGPRGRGGQDEEAILAKTRELDDLEAVRTQDERQAVGAIDEVLQVPQRAQFRIFLENIERQKLELLMRARQGRGN